MIQSILADYQKIARDNIINDIKSNRKTLVVKSPTGSGKTVILLSVIDKYLKEEDSDMVFVWLCPGTGDLEQQSKKSMDEKCNDLETRTISDNLSSGFERSCTYFLNWEVISKKTNVALKSSERKNLHQRIATAHGEGIKFIIIIDEEHQNDTAKAQDIIDELAAKKEIRMSATARFRQGCSYYEIKEEDVIQAGYITKAIVINESLKNYTISKDNEVTTLLDLALKKRDEIAAEYDALFASKLIPEKINPLILVQFPSMSTNLINYVEEYLTNKGIGYDNGLLARWMASESEKINLGFDPDWNIQDNFGFPIVLLMKQAISTGWDCPRAKILVKLRENMDENFEIQTIGRIRRMPERKHYGLDALDCCFLYTLDDKYVESVKESTNSLFEITDGHLIDDAKQLILTKEVKHQSQEAINLRRVYQSLFDHFKKTYGLGGTSENVNLLKKHGYIFNNSIIRKFRTGKYETFDDLMKDTNEANLETFYVEIDKKNNFALLNAQTKIGKKCSLDAVDTAKLLRRLFQKGTLSNNKVLSLKHLEFYAFVVNNRDKIADDFVEARNVLVKQYLLEIEPNTQVFRIPETEKLKFDPNHPNNSKMTKNVYEEYTHQMIAGSLRSKTEKMFENYCEINSNVKWVYKNGDVGSNYFCITFIDSFGKEWQFYPDYIVKLTNGSIYIIEAKGGEKIDGSSLNIDKKSANKFEAFKQYAQKYPDINWGFVRNFDEQLYFNNKNFVESMLDPNWELLNKIF